LLCDVSTRCAVVPPPGLYGVVGTGLLCDVSTRCAVVPSRTDEGPKCAGSAGVRKRRCAHLVARIDGALCALRAVSIEHAKQMTVRVSHELGEHAEGVLVGFVGRFGVVASLRYIRVLDAEILIGHLHRERPTASKDSRKGVRQRVRGRSPCDATSPRWTSDITIVGYRERSKAVGCPFKHLDDLARATGEDARVVLVLRERPCGHLRTVQRGTARRSSCSLLGLGLCRHATAHS
jgi:hypothetical protein